MFLLISTVVILLQLKSSVGLQDATQRNQVQQDVKPIRIENPEYYYGQRQAHVQQSTQQYMPVPIQLLQRSVYNQQPQAALIIIKAYPVYLSQNHNGNYHQGGIQTVQNIQTVQPVSHPRLSSYLTASESRSLSSPIYHQGSNQVSNPNSALFFAQPSNNLNEGGYINQLAQAVAQQYSKSPNSYKTPAIITGLENFSSEQQGQIKNYLKNYISSHSDENTRAPLVERTEMMNTGDESKEKYSVRSLVNQYSHQTDWRPGHQAISPSIQNYSTKP